ncbi:MAG: alpha/beta hydrolase [Tenuifilaceae bacterium]|jgi:pimeloyl-ACP methyl ester carboxylesterase|nr:alpha/beta hydrolase [Tenuifilaceae bacterium]
MKKIISVIVISVLVVGSLALYSCSSKAPGKASVHYVDYVNYRVHYRIYGDQQSAKTLLFIHGWSGNLNVWRYQVNAFPGYKVIAVDLPGHGLSSNSVDATYSVGVFAEAIAAVMTDAKVSKAFVFGHSMGFSVAEVFALLYPTQVEGIGSIDGAHFIVDDDTLAQQEWAQGIKMFAATMNEEKGREDFIKALFSPQTPQAIQDEILTESKLTPLSVGQQVIASMTDDMSFWKKRVVSIPCFAVHAPVYQLSSEYKADFMSMYPQAAYHTMDSVSHFLMLEKPEELNALVADYLKEVY